MYTPKKNLNKILKRKIITNTSELMQRGRIVKEGISEQKGTEEHCVQIKAKPHQTL